MLAPVGARKADCLTEVAALHSDQDWFYCIWFLGMYVCTYILRRRTYTPNYRIQKSCNKPLYSVRHKWGIKFSLKTNNRNTQIFPKLDSEYGKRIWESGKWNHASVTTNVVYGMIKG